MSEELLGVEALEKRVASNKATAAHFAEMGADGLERSPEELSKKSLLQL